LNPIVGVIDGFRWCILGGQNTFYWPGFILSFSVAMILMFGGLAYFRSTEREFADLI